MRYNPKAKLDSSQVNDKRRDMRPNYQHMFYDKFDDLTRNRSGDKSFFKFMGRKMNSRGAVSSYYNQQAAHDRGIQNGTSMGVRRAAMERRLKRNG